jgi:hypothetical protein
MPEADVAQGHLVALMVLPEAAGSARACGEVDVLAADLVAADPDAFLPQEVGEISRREAGRATLADVGYFPPGEKILFGRGRQRLRAIPLTGEHGAEYALGPPMQPAEQNRDVRALVPGERARRIGAVRRAIGC